MRKIIKNLPVTVGIFALCLNIFASSSQKKEECPECIPRQGGGLKGRVISRDGRPLSKINVYAENKASLAGLIRSTRTNRFGEFTLNGLRPGIYNVYAGNDALGYPEDPLGFYREPDQIHEITVQANKISANVTIKLGAKPGRIKGIIIDADSKAFLKDAKIKLQLISDPNYKYELTSSDNSRFSFFVPSTPFIIEVEAPEFKVWSKEINSSTFKVRPGQTKEILVSLER